jgi:hypothetical protein
MNELNLNNSLKNVDFVSKTILQIEKDFERSGVKINLSPHGDRESIENGIYEALTNLNPVTLQQLIYIIDIPENEFFKLQSNDFFFNALSEKILRREALKVFLRENLSA